MTNLHIALPTKSRSYATRVHELKTTKAEKGLPTSDFRFRLPTSELKNTGCELDPGYLIKQFGNRTQSNTNRSIAELNRTHNKILPIEHNRTFDSDERSITELLFDRTIFTSHDRHVVCGNSVLRSNHC